MEVYMRGASQQIQVIRSMTLHQSPSVLWALTTSYKKYKQTAMHKITLISKYISTSLLVGIAASLSGQIAQGTFSVGPSMSYVGVSEKWAGFSGSYDTRSFSLGASGSYFVIDNMALSLGGIRRASITDSGDIEESSTATYIGPTLTYMIPIGAGWYLPILGGVGHNRQDYDFDSGEFTLTGLSYGIGIGLEYLIADRIGARWQLDHITGTLGDTDSDFEIDIRQTTSTLGFQIYLGR